MSAQQQSQERRRQSHFATVRTRSAKTIRMAGNSPAEGSFPLSHPAWYTSLALGIGLCRSAETPGRLQEMLTRPDPHDHATRRRTRASILSQRKSSASKVPIQTARRTWRATNVACLSISTASPCQTTDMCG